SASRSACPVLRVRDRHQAAVSSITASDPLRSSTSLRDRALCAALNSSTPTDNTNTASAVSPGWSITALAASATGATVTGGVRKIATDRGWTTAQAKRVSLVM